MEDDEPFLRAIAENVADDTARLVYAEWLEERGDPRASFLRVQHALAQKSLDSPGYRELCVQEQELVRRLDPAWIQRVRRYTTPAPCRDLAVLVPEMRDFARTTTRLHPHRAAGPLPVWVSKIGGRFLWPRSETWPSCAKCNVDLAPVFQLRSRDVPDVAFPAGTDLLQLFWCPDEAAHGYEPAPRIWWRAEATVTSPRADDPDLSGFPRPSYSEGYVPFECAVYPEPVVEYILYDDLYDLAGPKRAAEIEQLLNNLDIGPADDLADRFGGEYGFSDPQSLVFYELGQCPGSKVGGKPALWRDGRKFDHLVTLSTWELDSASFRRWLAVEDQRLFAPPGEPLTWPLLRVSEFEHSAGVLGMNLGRTQRVHVYVCREREPWEVFAYVND